MHDAVYQVPYHHFIGQCHIVSGEVGCRPALPTSFQEINILFTRNVQVSSSRNAGGKVAHNRSGLLCTCIALVF